MRRLNSERGSKPTVSETDLLRSHHQIPEQDYKIGSVAEKFLYCIPNLQFCLRAKFRLQKTWCDISDESVGFDWDEIGPCQVTKNLILRR